MRRPHSGFVWRVVIVTSCALAIADSSRAGEFWSSEFRAGVTGTFSAGERGAVPALSVVHRGVNAGDELSMNETLAGGVFIDAALGTDIGAGTYPAASSPWTAGTNGRVS